MAVAGKGGSVKIGAVTVAEITSWSLDIEGDMLEITNFGSSGWKEYIAGLKGWSGSFEGEWKVATDTTGQKALQDAILGGTSVSLVLSVNGTNTYTGTAFIQTESVGTPVDDVVSLSFDFQGTAALTYA